MPFLSTLAGQCCRSRAAGPIDVGVATKCDAVALRRSDRNGFPASRQRILHRPEAVRTLESHVHIMLGQKPGTNDQATVVIQRDVESRPLPLLSKGTEGSDAPQPVKERGWLRSKRGIEY